MKVEFIRRARTNPPASSLVLTHIYHPERRPDTCPNTSPVSVANRARVFASQDRHLLCVLKIHPSPPPRAKTGPLSSGPPTHPATGPQFPIILAPPPASRVYREPCGRWCVVAAAAPPQWPANRVRPAVLAHCAVAAALLHTPFSKLCDILRRPNASDTTRCAPTPKPHRLPTPW